jgi:hypothetical protein
MKHLILFALITANFALYSQSTPTPADSLYIVTYTTGEKWDTSKSPGEQSYFKEHGARLGQLRKDGVIKFGARYADKGMIIIAAANFNVAKDIVTADIAVQNKLFTADIQRFNIFYDGCLERRK